MDKIKIYCEDGSMNKEIRSLNSYQSVELITFPFENFNKRTVDSKRPSELTCDSTFITADSDILISDTDRSEIFESLEKIIGARNYDDIRHVDTAYKEKCRVFISPDKRDIVNKGEELEKLTGIKFFYCREINAIKSYINTLI